MKKQTRPYHQHTFVIPVKFLTYFANELEINDVTFKLTISTTNKSMSDLSWFDIRALTPERWFESVFNNKLILAVDHGFDEKNLEIFGSPLLVERVDLNYICDYIFGVLTALNDNPDLTIEFLDYA